MRTTVDIPQHLHHRLMAVANDKHQTLSQTVVEAVVRWLEPEPAPTTIEISPLTGLPLMDLGRGPITSEDVRSLEDDE